MSLLTCKANSYFISILHVTICTVNTSHILYIYHMSYMYHIMSEKFELKHCTLYKHNYLGFSKYICISLGANAKVK